MPKKSGQNTFALERKQVNLMKDEEKSLKIKKKNEERKYEIFAQRRNDHGNKYWQGLSVWVMAKYLVSNLPPFVHKQLNKGHKITICRQCLTINTRLWPLKKKEA